MKRSQQIEIASAAEKRVMTEPLRHPQNTTQGNLNRCVFARRASGDTAAIHAMAAPMRQAGRAAVFAEFSAVCLSGVRGIRGHPESRGIDRKGLPSECEFSAPTTTESMPPA